MANPFGGVDKEARYLRCVNFREAKRLEVERCSRHYKILINQLEKLEKEAETLRKEALGA
jgi:hypothetical protein